MVSVQGNVLKKNIAYIFRTINHTWVLAVNLSFCFYDVDGVNRVIFHLDGRVKHWMDAVSFELPQDSLQPFLGDLKTPGNQLYLSLDLDSSDVLLELFVADTSETKSLQWKHPGDFNANVRCSFKALQGSVRILSS